MSHGNMKSKLISSSKAATILRRLSQLLWHCSDTKIATGNMFELWLMKSDPIAQFCQAKLFYKVNDYKQFRIVFLK